MRREFFDLWLAKYLKPQGWRGRQAQARRMQAKALADIVRTQAAQNARFSAARTNIENLDSSPVRRTNCPPAAPS